MPSSSGEMSRKREPGAKKKPATRKIGSLLGSQVRDETLAKTQRLIHDVASSAANAARHVASSRPAKWAWSRALDIHPQARRQQIRALLTNCWVWAKSRSVTTSAQLQAWTNALFTTELAKSLASWTAEKFNRNYDKYDEAIDRLFNAGEGGGSATHHLVDGSHTLVGAIREASKVYEDDSTIGEVLRAVEHLLRDLASQTGIQPFFNLTRDQLESHQEIAGKVGIAKSRVNDFLQLNVPEVLGAFFAVVPVWFGWSKLDAEGFADIAGSAGVAALIQANPLLGLIALVSMARSFNLLLSKEGEAFGRAAGRGALGAVQTSVVYAASAAIGGHVAIGVVVGLVVAYAIRRYSSSSMAHEQMVGYIAQTYVTRIFPAISGSTEATLALFHRLQQTFQFHQEAGGQRTQ